MDTIKLWAPTVSPQKVPRYYSLLQQMFILYICDVLLYAESVAFSKEIKPMRRLSIEVTPEQHQRLKAIAALHGQTIKDYVLERALPPLPEMDALSEEEALHQLETLLKPRIEAAERGEVVSKSVEQIFHDVRREPGL